MRPTIVDVARAAGVSPATVSNALTGKRPVEARTRLRVQDAAATLHYVPDARGRRLRTGHPAAIAIVSSMPPAIAAGPSRLGFMMEIAAAAAVAALESGLAVVLVPPLDGVAPSLGHLDVGGALVVEPVEDDLHLRFMLDRGWPVVSIGRPGRRASIPFVDLRSSFTARLLLDHLYAAGARHIALLAGSQRRNSYSETVRAYRRFAEANGMAARVTLVDEHGGEQAGYAAALGLLRDHPDVDAICAPVDAFAVGAVQAARAVGRRIPDTLKVVTRYDGLRSRTCEPPLTAVDLHLDDVARHAVSLLLGLLGLPVAGNAVPQPSLIARASSRREGVGPV